jgi:hypothetical protein
MLQLPENIRPAVALLVKHHFWLLAIVVPLVVLPLLFAARGGLLRQINVSKSQIKGKLDAMQSVRRVEPHPNAGWEQEIEADTARIRRDTLGEWQKFWESQEFLRVWPKELGADFLDAVATLKPDGRLDRNLLQRYQNTIPEIVRKLPARMGAGAGMAEEREPGSKVGGGQPVGRDGDRERRSQAILTWNPTDQRRLLSSFEWAKLPTNPQAATTQVMLAQEELWVYGLFCDLIAKANKDAGGVHNAAIVAVEELAVGYPAAQEKPGGMGSGRILVPKQAASGDAGQTPPDMSVPGGDEGRQRGKSPHPRFGGGVPSAGTEGTPGVAPDASLREWIYVDFDGQGLSAADLATSPAARMVHLMPFVLRLTIDERRLDALLVDLAQAPIPIDVREVRINPGSRPGPDAKAGRGHDAVVELRGTVGLATPPSAAAVGLESPPPAATDSATAAPRRPADRRHAWRRAA